MSVKYFLSATVILWFLYNSLKLLAVNKFILSNAYNSLTVNLHEIIKLCKPTKTYKGNLDKYAPYLACNRNIILTLLCLHISNKMYNCLTYF